MADPVTVTDTIAEIERRLAAWEDYDFTSPHPLVTAALPYFRAALDGIKCHLDSTGPWLAEQMATRLLAAIPDPKEQ